MSTLEIHKSDIGTVITITIKDGTNPVDISSATQLKIRFKKPDRTLSSEKDATLVNDGTDGKMKYTSIADDFDQSGNWTIQGYVKLNTGEWSSSTEKFTVGQILT